MNPVPAGNLLAYLAQVSDPRGRQGLRHSLEAMLATVVCAVLCGARGYTAIAEWIHAQDVKTWHCLGYWRKPPTRNAFRNLLLKLVPEELETAVRQWVGSLLSLDLAAEALHGIALDGKSLCGTLSAHERTVHLLSLLDQQTGFVLSQMQVDAKTNEPKAALKLLETLVLKGRIVTGDALLCQREICQKIIDSGGHYFFVVKDNQPSLKDAIASDFEPGFSPLQRTATASPALRSTVAR